MIATAGGRVAVATAVGSLEYEEGVGDWYL